MKRYEFLDKDGKIIAVEKANGYFEALRKAGLEDEDVSDYNVSE